ncbi:hypothetical protein NQZ68_000097 [Dissostichus eleginoides]|nr:hypothetical protein NQZ68_000097 [Dissostichus eleginoides]
MKEGVRVVGEGGVPSWSTDAGPFQQHKPGLSSLRWALGRTHGVYEGLFWGGGCRWLCYKRGAL